MQGENDMAERLAVLVTITEAKGSAPRTEGTRMLVTASGQEGTIGGGRLEYEATSQARKLLADPEKTKLVQQYALGPLLEQCCGGSVVLELEKMAPSIARDQLSEKAPGASLYMFGAGHVGRAVATALAPLDFKTVWVDSREAEFPSVVPSGCKQQVTEDPLAIVQAAVPDAFYLVFTHSHQLDYDITAAVLARGDARYCGLIGSKTKRARFENRMLRERVIDETGLPRLTCPIGVPGIAGKEPEVIAASVVAQLLTLV